MGSIYNGYRELHLSDDEFADFYAGLYDLSSLNKNEYALLYNDKNELVEKIRYVGDGSYQRVRYPIIVGKRGETVKGRNEHQNCAIDLLLNPTTKVKLIRGRVGSGKDFLMTAAALHLIERGKFSKIVFIRPNVTVADVPDIGYLSGDVKEKLDWTLGPLHDKLGGADIVDMMIKKGTIELVPLIHIRGRSFDDAIVYVTEGQNLTRNLVKLLISRLGENSEIWFNGDEEQVDKAVYKNDNGFVAMTERLKGNPLFGTIYLPKTERSQVADLANLLDDNPIEVTK